MKHQKTNSHDALDNPIWSSLTGAHARFASGGDALRVYPWEMVPFAAVPSSTQVLTTDVLDATLQDRPFVYFVGTLPRVDSDRYAIEPHDDILQMLCAQLQPPPKASDAAVRDLDASNVEAMLELMARVYPAYFRARTIEMGRYAGIFDGDELVAMAGLRMAPQGFREISGVCTDPRSAGRGYAAKLVRYLADAVIAEGRTPMLHQDLDNERARRLYESLGFVARANVPMCKLVRVLP